MPVGWVPYGKNFRADMSRSWLIFRKWSPLN
jgi:hypothetical protein